MFPIVLTRKLTSSAFKETNEYMIWWELTQPVSFFVGQLSFLFQSSLFSLPKHIYITNEKVGRVIDEKI
ncbi:hypothetical protein ACA29_09925 [Lederbergia galactosidilytica]|uniref:Uncharacterized protein n=1 Tax=Lederbergia galactosidilytica TaxID=217031 RepID=A0A0Q9YAF8_9BACI|nr:hypothetical protein ACA29_09925 [Lederbergia galactosidilytica]